MIYDSLNAIRVIGEFWIIHFHLSGYVGESSVTIDILAHDILSLFFVLSGCVAILSTEGDNINDYFWRRLRKTYPIYCIFVTCTLISAFSRNEFGDGCKGLYWSCIIGDYLLFSPWLFCSTVTSTPGPAWYLTSIYWLWLVFPWLKRRFMPVISCWCGILGLYVLSYMPFILGAYYPQLVNAGCLYNNIARVPLFRVFEFMMGMGVGGMLKRACLYPEIYHYMWVIHLIYPCYLLISYLWTKNYEDTCRLLKSGPSCYAWDASPDVKTCIPLSDFFLNKTSIAWAALLFHVGGLEDTGKLESHAVFSFLKWKFWGYLSSFSLQVYLAHLPIADLYRLIMPKVQLNLLMIAAYSWSYAFYIFIQPHIDKMVEWKLATDRLVSQSDMSAT